MRGRSDPFWLGRMAFLDHADRSACPYPPNFFEAQRWCDGWDHAQTDAASGRLAVY